MVEEDTNERDRIYIYMKHAVGISEYLHENSRKSCLGKCKQQTEIE